MKIGILTLPLHTNYGGILQAYALQTVLEKEGNEVTIFDTSRIKSFPGLFTISKRIIKSFINHNECIFYEQKHNKEYPIISQYTQLFIEKYLNRIIIKRFNEICESNYDAIVVGSDQVWRPKYFCSLYSTSIDNAYLAFTNNWNIKRIAYAASFGTEEWEYNFEQTNICSKLLKEFNAISVREVSGINLCKENLFCDATHVLDPTMLLDKDDYMKLIGLNHEHNFEGNLLCYILDDTAEKEDIIKRIAVNKSLIPFRNNSKVENNRASIEDRIQPPVETWLSGFYNADFVITDSFHACVFSIIFNKPFIVIGNEKRGLARFKSLLSIFKLEECLVIPSQYKTIQDFPIIDWTKVNNILTEWKERSFDFIIKALYS